MASLEITDVIVDFDPATLARRPVRKQEALAKLQRTHASSFALREVERLPERDGVLDDGAVDAVILGAHTEMQRLWETMAHGVRVQHLLRALVAAARENGASGPLRVVDVGCGAGYIIRWLAAHGGLGEDVRLIGADYNAALIARAQRLAQVESLPAEFIVANAFQLREPATFYLSTGVLHHFDDGALAEFFREQRGAHGFVHFDIRRTWAAPIGAWLFHKAKMRIRVGQHDGYMSAVRAHDTETLLAAAKRGAPRFAVLEHNRAVPFLPMVRAMHAVVGIDPAHLAAFRRALGAGERALGPAR